MLLNFPMVQREEVTALVPTQQVGGFEVDRGSDPHHRSFAKGRCLVRCGIRGCHDCRYQSSTTEGGMSMRILRRVPSRPRARWRRVETSLGA